MYATVYGSGGEWESGKPLSSVFLWNAEQSSLRSNFKRVYLLQYNTFVNINANMFGKREFFITTPVIFCFCFLDVIPLFG